MKKEMYEKAEMQVVEFEAEDVITTSGEVEIPTEENELPIM
ncbi:MAG: hypothetical protein ACI4FO_09560 [Acutalibacteraceae bacterium]